jgi:MoxR-like ATPase
MNDDASTYELPEYIHSRLQPQIFLDFPEHDEEKQILSENLPFSDEQILEYVTSFLQTAHAADEPFTVRDGVNIARYALKLLDDKPQDPLAALRASIRRILGVEALRHLPS